jgi:GntR family transcriptional regulator/MocR family aminotransferase
MSIYRGIYERIRSSIAEGALKPGDTLPSARALASELGVARGTVDAAYATLAGEGYTVIRQRGGSIVSPQLPAEILKGDKDTVSPDAEDIALYELDPPFKRKLPLTPGVPSLDLFPRGLWSQLVVRQARRIAISELSYADPRGDPALRIALTAYLSIARGIECSPDQIYITGGYQSALGLLSRLLLTPDSRVLVEDPGYGPTRKAIELLGATAISIPVDGEGLNVEAVLRLGLAKALCIVTPANQFPLNVSLSPRRRLELLEWANQSDSWILEDDYDGEFRHRGRALPALKSLDRADRVFYIGTFSKTLYPGLRLGYVVVPNAQVEPFGRILRWLDGGRPRLEQAVLAEFLAQGHFARHLKRMRDAYDSRRTALTTSISDVFGPGFKVDPTSGGLHLTLRIPPHLSDDRLAARAVMAGLRPMALSRMARAGDHHGLLLGFAGVAEPEAPDMARRLRAAVSD